MSAELEAVELTAWLAGVSAIVVGYTARLVVRQVESLHSKADRNAEGIARIEGSLENGLRAEVRRIHGVEERLGGMEKHLDKIDRDLAQHMESEESRLVSAVMAMLPKLKQQGGS